MYLIYLIPKMLFIKNLEYYILGPIDIGPKIFGTGPDRDRTGTGTDQKGPVRKRTDPALIRGIGYRG